MFVHVVSVCVNITVCVCACGECVCEYHCVCVCVCMHEKEDSSLVPRPPTRLGDSSVVSFEKL